MTGKKPEHPLTYGELNQRLEEKTQELEQLHQNYDELRKDIQRIVTSFPTGLIVVNKKQLIEAVNSRARAMFEYESAELAHQPVNTIFPDTQHIELNNTPLRIAGKRKSQEVFAAEITVNLLDYQGEEMFFVNVQDVTERQKLEQLRKDLIAMVSHDIRGPLTSVRVFLEMLRAGMCGELNDRGTKLSGNAQTAVDYLMALVKNLLDAEKTESGTIEIEVAETSIGAIINKAVITANGAKDRASVRIESDFTNDRIFADEDRIVQVLINLISNAIKYSPNDSEVRVTGGMEGLNARFQVIDSGPGIPKEMAHLIFERFRQLEQHKAIKQQGFGLGLAICKALVESHRGKIWVDSTVGQGSKFTFTIPAQPD